jgi:carboxymethylenebutenolidase
VTAPHPEGFLAVPAIGRGNGVLVLHAWWGLNDAIKGQADGRLAVIGFSLGAYYALDLAATSPEHIGSVVVFYGTGSDHQGRSRAAYLGHFAEQDPYEPQANVDSLEESLRRAGRPVTFHRYSGTGHWFFEPDRSEAYNQAAASLAWDRTLVFLRRSSW